MSIMREKPLICKDWFNVPMLTRIRANKEVSITDFINASAFFEEVGKDINANLVDIKQINYLSRNGRTYPTDIWSWGNPFRYPRFRLFQIENSCLLCRGLIK